MLHKSQANNIWVECLKSALWIRPCMEVIVLRGAVREIRALSDGLLSLKGVKHGISLLLYPHSK
jgi:metal-responsive CopG/Arc/MetJ family transcriptional regulator